MLTYVLANFSYVPFINIQLIDVNLGKDYRELHKEMY